MSILRRERMRWHCSKHSPAERRNGRKSPVKRISEQEPLCELHRMSRKPSGPRMTRPKHIARPTFPERPRASCNGVSRKNALLRSDPPGEIRSRAYGVRRLGCRCFPTESNADAKGASVKSCAQVRHPVPASHSLLPVDLKCPETKF